MTVARKIGALLLLLTMGSLLGIATFTVFLARTSYDAVFLVATTMSFRLLQDLEINTLLILSGKDDLRPAQKELIQKFDEVLTAIEKGGSDVRPGSPGSSVGLLTELNDLASSSTVGLDAASDQMAAAVSARLPDPPPYIRDRAAALRVEWERWKGPIQVIAEKSATDRDAIAASVALRESRGRVAEASRRLTVAGADRINAQRQVVLYILASISVFSIALFVLGILMARRYISRPIEALQDATERALNGDFSHRAPILSKDEIAILARRFNAMLDEVNRSVMQYRQLFENANDFVYIADLDGRFLSANRAGELLTGYSRAELQKMRIDDLAAPEHAQLPWQMREVKMSGGQEATVYELEMIRKDGRRITLETSTRLMFEGTKAVALQGVGRDVTERKRLQEQLRVAQKMEAVGRFAGGIAHDFGNVLTIINGYCALILNRIRADDPMRNEVEGIQRAGKRAAGLIRHLLGFSKGQIFRPRLIRVETAINEMREMLVRLVGEDVRLIVQIERGVGAVRFDPTQLEQVIVNLVLNARDSMPSGGRMTIEATVVDVDKAAPSGPDDLAPGKHVSLRFSDTGHGMPPEVLSQIFEPFFSTKERGTGLGLSTVYGIVRQSGGRISATSQVHAGTTISLLLPRLEESVDYVQVAASVRLARGTETILIAEDEVDVRMLVGEMLRHAGYTVLEAKDQGHAVQICDNMNQKIDLLLTDVVMPHVSGPQLAAAVRRVRPELKVIYMSGYPRDKFEEDGLQTDMIHFIQKPLSSESLLSLVREVLDGTEKG